MGENPLHILFPVDVDESTEALIPAAKDLLKMGVEEIRLLHIVHPIDALAVPDLIDQRQEILQKYRQKLLAYGISTVHGEVVIGTPWMEIAKRVQSGEIAFILMGSQGKGLFQRIFLGSLTENVLYHTYSSLFILRLRMERDRFVLAHENLFSHILYATDLSEGARKGISLIEHMALASEKLTVAHVEDVRHLEYASPEILRKMRDNAERELMALKETFLERGFRRVDIILRKGNAISELLHLIDSIQPSLLVMGAKGTYSIEERALGGVAESLIHRAPVHILLGR